jgi:hypothetical protein
MTDREMLLAIAAMLGALCERLTGERLTVFTQTDHGEVAITSAGSCQWRPLPPAGAGEPSAYLEGARAKYPEDDLAKRASELEVH